MLKNRLLFSIRVIINSVDVKIQMQFINYVIITSHAKLGITQFNLGKKKIKNNLSWNNVKNQLLFSVRVIINSMDVKIQMQFINYVVINKLLLYIKCSCNMTA